MDNASLYSGPERRNNIRLKEPLSAEFVFINDVKSSDLSGKEKSVVHNISAGGCCLEVKNLKENWKEQLFSGMIKIALKIDIPGAKEDVMSIGKVAWISKLWQQGDEKKDTYLMGLEFVDISRSAEEAIKNYIVTAYFNNAK